jgi:hypothetical protein
MGSARKNPILRRVVTDFDREQQPHPRMNVREKGLRMSNSQRALAARRERPKPQYILRAKVGSGWTTIGAVWPLRSGEQGFSLKITSMPLQWDGRFVALPPIEDEEDARLEPPEE